jgi:hypothetical protein
LIEINKEGDFFAPEWKFSYLERLCFCEGAFLDCGLIDRTFVWGFANGKRAFLIITSFCIFEIQFQKFFQKTFEKAHLPID